MYPTLIHLGPFRLATYGVLVAAGYLAGILWLASERERMGLSEREFWNLIYALFAGAILGGKLLYWAVEWRALLSGELRPFRDFRYGFVFLGGFYGSVVAGLLYRRRVSGPYLAVADYFGVALPMGHAIGRLGCLAAGCCYGRPTELPWGIRFTHPETLVEERLIGVPLHPAQLYEAAANAAIAWLMLRLLRRTQGGDLKPGTPFLAYIAVYSAARFAVELFRGDDRGGFWLGLSVSQWIGLAAFAVAGGWMLRRGAREARA